MLLKSGDEDKVAEYYNSLQQRANETCTWIVSAANFREWLTDSKDGHSNPAPKFCILLGHMGTGKSVTTGFVADFLVAHRALPGP
jgi:hypothetical protein